MDKKMGKKPAKSSDKTKEVASKKPMYTPPMPPKKAKTGKMKQLKTSPDMGR